MSRLLVVPDRSGLGPSGGDRYDAALAEAWRDQGRVVQVVTVPGRWPWPDEPALRALARALQGTGPVVLDGLVGCAAPDVVEEAARRRPVAMLVHSVLSEGAGVAGEEGEVLDRREARALAAATVVVATSEFAADDLRRRYGLRHVAVARPGADPAPVAAGTGHPPQLLTLGTVSPAKNQSLVLEALDAVSDLPWRALVVGPAQHLRLLRSLQHRAQELDLDRRVQWYDALGGEELEQIWAQTDLLVHPSRSETYGLVVVEAHARGIPTVVGAGTGAVEALVGEGGPEPGRAVRTDRPAQLAATLRSWLTDPALRQEWREAALRRRDRLQGWAVTAARVDAALSGGQAR